MSGLIDAMIIHIHHLVHDEQRPFSYLDFMKFEVDDHEFKMTHGTFRNIISRLVQEGLVEVSYKSSITFYTLRGIKFDNVKRIAMTGNHTGVRNHSQAYSSNPLYRIVRDLPLARSSIHDIRLRFSSPGIYAIISSSSSNDLDHNYTVNSRSKDILLPAWKIRDLLIKATIHRTDTVSIMIGCSLDPISLDIVGLIRLTNALSIVEERLSKLVEESQNCHAFTTVDSKNSSAHDRHGLSSEIPPYSSWIVTMWHFGADALIEYCGERFAITWETAENVLVRAYSKVLTDNKRRIRLERQEYPDAILADIIEERLAENRGFHHD